MREVCDSLYTEPDRRRPIRRAGCGAAPSGACIGSTLLVLVLTLAVFAAGRIVTAQGQQAATANAGARSVLYSALRAELTRYEVQLGPPALVKREAITLPGPVQYAWPHPTNRYLYVTWTGGPSDRPHGLAAFALDPATGALRPHGEPVGLKSRPIHVTVDKDATHVLVAHSNPSSVTVRRLSTDGKISDEVAQPATLDAGVFAHQVRVHPSGGTVILVARGNSPLDGAPKEDPGALKVYSYKGGVLGNRASIAPKGGFGFQPRHMDFHPSGKWIYVSAEWQNELHVFSERPDGTLGSQPLFVKFSLPSREASRREHRQIAGTVRVHPNGRFVYQANRATGFTDTPEGRIWNGGTNSIAVYQINQSTGEPTLIQQADTRGIVPRTFAFDATQRLLVAANQTRMSVREGQSLTTVMPNLALFTVGEDGKLTFVRKYDVAADLAVQRNDGLFWMGIVPLPR